MPVGAALGVATVGGAAISAGAAKSAAKTQAAAADRSAQMQLDMFNTIRGDLSPYRAVGSAAMPGYLALLGIPTGGGGGMGAFTGASAPTPDWASYGALYPDVAAEYQKVNGPGLAQALGLSNDKNASLSPEQFYAWHYQNKGQTEGRQLPMIGGSAATGASGAAAPGFDAAARQAFLESTPGYQFARDQGMQAVENKLASRGLGGLSGPLGKGLARFVTGLADQTYQSQLQNYGNAVTMGQNAANQTGTFGQAATQGAAGSLMGGANASAAGTVGAANAISGGLTGAANGYLTSRILGMYAPQAAAAPALDAATGWQALI